MPASFASYIAMSAARSMSVALGRPASCGRCRRSPPIRVALGQVERPVERTEHASRDRGGLVLVDVLEQHRELVAAEAGRRVLGPDRPARRSATWRMSSVALDVTE